MKTILAKLTGILAMLVLTSTLALAKDGWGGGLRQRPRAGEGGQETRAARLHRFGLVRVVHQARQGGFLAGRIRRVREEKPRPRGTGLPAQQGADEGDQGTEREAAEASIKIEGYPTIIVLNAEGKKVGELGYQPGGPKAFIAALEKLKEQVKGALSTEVTLRGGLSESGAASFFYARRAVRL